MKKSASHQNLKSKRQNFIQKSSPSIEQIDLTFAPEDKNPKASDLRELELESHTKWLEDFEKRKLASFEVKTDSDAKLQQYLRQAYEQIEHDFDEKLLLSK